MFFIKSATSPSINITVFQALTLLAEKYQNQNDKKYQQIKALYLSGVQSEEDKNNLKQLLTNPLLNTYTISAQPHDINEDPVRRYFESHLCHEILKEQLDSLDLQQLQQHYEALLELVSSNIKAFMRSVALGTLKKDYNKLSPIKREFVESITNIQKPNSYLSLKPETDEKNHTAIEIWQKRKTKLILLHLCTFTAIAAKDLEYYPIDIYDEEGSIYEQVHRGRTKRSEMFDNESHENTVCPYSLGIMRAYMPIAPNDPLLSPTPSAYRRPTDINTYMNDGEPHLISDIIFATQVTPFINSISGTFLAQLRVTAHLRAQNKFIYEPQDEFDEQTKKELHNYIRLILASVIYSLGGHSIYEFMMLFQCPEVIQELQSLPGLKTLTIEHLFKIECPISFDNALQLTIKYNRHILHQKMLHRTLFALQKIKPLQHYLKPTPQNQVDPEAINLEIEATYQRYLINYDDNERQKLLDLLLVQLPTNANQMQINAAMKLIIEHTMQKIRNELYSGASATLDKRLDKAWAIYTDQQRLPEVRALAQNFLIEVLNINDCDTHTLRSILTKLMNEREQRKSAAPAFIPRRSVTLSVSNAPILYCFARQSTLLISPKPYLSPEECELYRVMITRGVFTYEGTPCNTVKSHSHRKKGFAYFSLNINGDFLVFCANDIISALDGIKPQSIPLVCVGEIEINDGRLISICDHHYMMPTIYHLYQALDYFKQQGLDISQTQVMTLIPPNNSIEIAYTRSPRDSRYFVCNAEELCIAHEKKLKQEAQQQTELIDVLPIQSVAF